MTMAYGIALLFGGLLAVNGLFAYQSKHIDPTFWPTVWFQLKWVPLMFAANVMIGFGIKFCYRTTDNLTFSLSLAKGIEIAICVLLGWVFLHEVPSWKTYAGVAAVVGGFVLMKWG
ncbi:hypothetical protein [Paenibacillus xanthanilyticus]|uniref:EamA domain-containing protein n=1 Tax=Paenibacillus xanthanilyticus TaxID=1783531 RepID=A0ABV8KDT3_9BACL